MAVVGVIPRGLSGYSNFLTVLDSSALQELIKGAFSVGVIGFVETTAMATQGETNQQLHDDIVNIMTTLSLWQFLVNRKYSKASNLDSTQELTALGCMNLLNSFFQGFPVAGEFKLCFTTSNTITEL